MTIYLSQNVTQRHEKWKFQHNPSQIISDISVSIPLTTISNVMDSTLTIHE